MIKSDSAIVYPLFENSHGNKSLSNAVYNRGYIVWSKVYVVKCDVSYTVIQRQRRRMEMRKREREAERK